MYPIVARASKNPACGMPAYPPMLPADAPPVKTATRGVEEVPLPSVVVPLPAGDGVGEDVPLVLVERTS